MSSFYEFKETRRSTGVDMGVMSLFPICHAMLKSQKEQTTK